MKIELTIAKEEPAIVFPTDSKNYSCVVADYDASDDNVWFDNAEYGKHWRYWLRKPTQEEMEAVPWEGGQHEKD